MKKGEPSSKKKGEPSSTSKIVKIAHQLISPTTLHNPS
jgi:hypothetical protein